MFLKADGYLSNIYGFVFFSINLENNLLDYYSGALVIIEGDWKHIKKVSLGNFLS